MAFQASQRYDGPFHDKCQRVVTQFSTNSMQMSRILPKGWNTPVTSCSRLVARCGGHHPTCFGSYRILASDSSGDVNFAPQVGSFPRRNFQQVWSWRLESCVSKSAFCPFL